MSIFSRVINLCFYRRWDLKRKKETVGTYQESIELARYKRESSDEIFRVSKLVCLIFSSLNQ